MDKPFRVTEEWKQKVERIRQRLRTEYVIEIRPNGTHLVRRPDTHGEEGGNDE